MKIISVIENPGFNRAIKFIQSKWASEQSMMVYEDLLPIVLPPLIYCHNGIY